MTEHPFNLQGAEYWTKPFKNTSALMFTAVTRKRASLTIDAPPDVDFAERKELPVPVLHVASQRDLAQFRFQDTALLTGVRLEDGLVKVASAMVAPPADREPDDEEHDETSFAGGTYTLDARARLGIPSERGTWVFTILLRDIVSNRVRSRVGKTADWNDPEVARFLAEQALPPAPSVSPAPDSPLPGYFAVAASPAVPTEPGLALAAPRVVVTKAGEKAVVAGSLRVAVQPRQITARAEGEPYPAVAGKAVGAVLPVTVIALSSNKHDPLHMVLTMQVPSFDAVPAGATDAVVTAHFAFDLFAQRGVQRAAHTYFLYAFCGEHMAGPVPVGLVTEDMLPGKR